MAKKKVEEPVYPVAPLKIGREKFCSLLNEQIVKGDELLKVNVPVLQQSNPYSVLGIFPVAVIELIIKRRLRKLLLKTIKGGETVASQYIKHHLQSLKVAIFTTLNHKYFKYGGVILLRNTRAISAGW